uniref:Uncharacterized protein n=1 Tax=Rousettus aegyptiacus TaxID=9407 RepID=A0A7J8FIX1_ROUAE|nr:hypothetical protein HJG63_012020 [Rousettus aegyptiacus]
MHTPTRWAGRLARGTARTLGQQRGRVTGSGSQAGGGPPCQVTGEFQHQRRPPDGLCCWHTFLQGAGSRLLAGVRALFWEAPQEGRFLAHLLPTWAPWRPTGGHSGVAEGHVSWGQQRLPCPTKFLLGPEPGLLAGGWRSLLCPGEGVEATPLRVGAQGGRRAGVSCTPPPCLLPARESWLPPQPRFTWRKGPRCYRREPCPRDAGARLPAPSSLGGDWTRPGIGPKTGSG